MQHAKGRNADVEASNLKFAMNAIRARIYRLAGRERLFSMPAAVLPRHSSSLHLDHPSIAKNTTACPHTTWQNTLQYTRLLQQTTLTHNTQLRPQQELSRDHRQRWACPLLGNSIIISNSSVRRQLGIKSPWRSSGRPVMPGCEGARPNKKACCCAAAAACPCSTTLPALSPRRPWHLAEHEA